MLKTARGVTIHADPLHHGDGTGIRRNGDGNDLAELSFLETIVEKRPRSLRHVALSPVSGSQAPTDLDRAVGQVRFEIRACKSTKTNRCIILPEGEREETEAGFVNISVVAIEERIGIRAVAAEGEKLHHLWIAVDLGKEIAIGLQPGTESEPLGLVDDHATKSVFR